MSNPVMKAKGEQVRDKNRKRIMDQKWFHTGFTKSDVISLGINKSAAQRELEAMRHMNMIYAYRSHGNTFKYIAVASNFLCQQWRKRNIPEVDSFRIGLYPWCLGHA